MKNKNKNNSVSYFDMQFITSSISTTLVLLLLGLVVFFVLGRIIFLSMSVKILIFQFSSVMI